MAILSAVNLKKTYITGEMRVDALRGVSLDIPEGDVVVMLGPSGSGKSTFLNIIGGLDRASAGHVYFRDQDLAEMNSHQLTLYRREHVGFVFQSYNLVPSLTALENVSLVTELVTHPMKPEDALDAVGLGNRARHFPSQLSGGEQQRVAIARAIAKNPELLLCDEPTGALDSETGIVVLKALINVNQTLGTTCIIITHNSAVARLADKVIHFIDGQVSRIDSNPDKIEPEQLTW
jgi:putative ABC transport system ATP-binding protein